MLFGRELTTRIPLSGRIGLGRARLGWRVLGVALVLAGVVLGGSWAMRFRLAADAYPDRELLVLAERRLGLVARFSGGVALPACLQRSSATSAACGSETSDIAAETLRGLARASDRRAGGDPLNADLLRRQALWQLLSRDDAAARNRAVSLLSLAMEGDVKNPARRNDLAAALLLRGAADGKPADWELALELADSAAADGQIEGSFNRALALDLLTLHRQARIGWRELTAQPGRRNAGRAIPTALRAGAERLAELSVRASQAELAVARGEFDLYPLRRRGERLMGAWGAAILAHQEDAAAVALRQAAAVAEHHASDGGDRLLLDATRRIQDSGDDEAVRLALAAGHAAYDRSRGNGLYAACGAELSLAERQLSAGGTPFAGWAHLDLAICGYFEKRIGDADRELDGAGAIAEAKPYPALQGRIRWIRGLLRMVAAELPAAEHEIRRASSAFAVAREPSHVAYLESLLAKTLDHAGDPGGAWVARWRALRQRSRLDLARLYTVFDEAADSALARGRRRAAAHFLRAQLHATVDSLPASGSVPSVAVFTTLDQVSLLRELGQRDEARAAVFKAQALWRRVPPENESWRQLGLEIATQRAALQGPLPRGLAAIDDEIAFLSQGESEHFEVLRLLLLRARLQLEADSIAGSETDLRRAVALVERDLRTVAADLNRARLLAAARPVYEALVELLLDAGRAREALDVLESASTLVSGGATEGIRGRPAPAIAPGTLAVRYAALPSRLVIWSLDAHGLHVETRAVTAANLRVVIAACRDAIASGAPDAGAEPGCRRAAQRLLPAALDSLRPGDRWVVVADGWTEKVPFAALPWGSNGRPLVERLRISLAPSLQPRAPLGSAGSDPTLLLVVDPRTSASAFPGLQQLKAAAASAGAIAELYPQSRLLTGDAATPARVLADLGRFDVAHFDVHGVLGDGEGEGVSLALASTSPRRRDGLLEPSDVATRRLERPRLVVLAGCETGLGRTDLPFAFGLPNALLRAGVRQVVSASWDIEDEAGTRFFLDFHRCSRSGVPADECLRRSQLALARSAQRSLSRPLAWSGYSLHDASWNSAAASVFQDDSLARTVPSTARRR